MGFPFQGIPVAAGFSLSSPLPVDTYGYVETRDDLNLPTHPTNPGVFDQHLRFIGRVVRVIDEGCLAYCLKQGVTDDDWQIDVTAPPIAIPLWQNDRQYKEGELIWQDKQIWRAISTHTTGASPITFADEEANWESGSADQYSNANPTLVNVGGIEAGATFANETLSDIMEKMFYPHVAPSITLTSVPAFGVRERGVPIPTLTLSAAFTQTKYPIARVEFFKDGTSVDNATITTPTGETLTHTDTTVDGMTDVAFKVEVEDTEGAVATKTGAFEFVNPAYIGSLASTVNTSNVTEADITAMTKVIAKPSTQSMNFTVSSRKFALWIPDNWTLTRVIDPNSFNMTASFNSVSVGINNEAGELVSGKVYILNTPTTQSNFAVSFFCE
jgi:hypothetical protein